MYNGQSVHYQLEKMKLEGPEGHLVEFYGVSARNSDNQTIVLYNDLWADQAVVKKYIDQWNQHSLSLIHLMDAIDDFFACV